MVGSGGVEFGRVRSGMVILLLKESGLYYEVRCGAIWRGRAW